MDRRCLRAGARGWPGLRSDMHWLRDVHVCVRMGHHGRRGLPGFLCTCWWGGIRALPVTVDVTDRTSSCRRCPTCTAKLMFVVQGSGIDQPMSWLMYSNLQGFLKQLVDLNSQVFTQIGTQQKGNVRGTVQFGTYTSLISFFMISASVGYGTEHASSW